MNLHDRAPRAPEVTTGPLPGSRKVFAAPEGHDDLRVPFREIALGKRAASRRSMSTTRQGLTPILRS